MSTPLSHEDALAASNLLEQAWEAAVKYRAFVYERGAVRGHLEDMDLFGILREFSGDGFLEAPPQEVMAKVLVADSRLDWLPPGIDAPQAIYDEGTHLLEGMGVLKAGWDE